VAVLLLSLAGEARAVLPEGSEICRFRAVGAENPFQRWLASQDVTCVAAGTPLAFPSGLWNVFVRAAGTISTAPLLIEGDTTAPLIDPPLVAAATLTPLLADGKTAVIYVPRRAAAYPVDAARVVVPAGEPLWLFVVEKSAPIALFSIAPLTAGSERTVDARGSGASSIVGWLHVPEAERKALASATGVTSPTMHAGSRDGDPLPAPSLLHGAFYRVGDVAAPTAEVRLEGRGWMADRRVVRVQPGVTIAPAPLFVRATGTLVVHWSSEEDLAALDRSIGSCDEEERPQVIIAISRCPMARMAEAEESEECVLIGEQRSDSFFGSVTFDGVAPGLHRAQMRYGKLPPVARLALVQPLRVADLRVEAHYYPLYGSVTRGGEPLEEKVRIEFPGGVGFAPEDSEEYRAVSLTPHISVDTQIRVEACDGAPRAIVLSDEMARRSSRHNIDIPANVLEVQVSDTFTRESLDGALVKLEAYALLRPSRVVFTTTREAGQGGIVTLPAVPVREIQLTVSHPGYDTRRIERFTMPKSGTHTIDAQLVPQRGTRGKITSERAFEKGEVVWYSPAGSQTERAELAPDGTFVYQNWHTAEETMVVIAASHPLWVMRAPELARHQSLNARFPDAPVVAFDVWLASAVPADEERYIGIAIGGVRIPQPVLAQHQTMRRNAALMRGAGPQHFRDLLATGAIDVLLGPRAADIEFRARHLDIFSFARYADVPRQRLEAGATDVVLTLKERER
jgi:hypothetical protein